MDQLLTSEFWKSEMLFVMSAPWIIIPLLIMTGICGWWLRGREDSGHIRGLQAQLGARDERLQLAREREEDVTAKLAVAKEETLALRNQLTRYAHNADGSLTGIGMSVVRAVTAIQDATTSSEAMRRTLTVGPTQFRTITEPPMR